VGRQLVELKVEAANKGRPISDAEAVEQLEHLLAALAKAATSTGQETGSEKPGSANRTLTAPQLAASAPPRKMTQDEHVQSLMNDKDFMSMIFG
jgi:hypothetical protein